MATAKSDLRLRSSTPTASIASVVKSKTPPPHAQAPAANSVPDSRALALSEIVSSVPPAQLESALSGSGVAPMPEHVEVVLRRSYSTPSAAVAFFRWSGRLLGGHTSYSWNLMVDILGKNSIFEPMWDAIRSMKQEGVLSTATFASAFESYCSAGRVKEAIMTFDVMDRYGIPPDVVAVNFLLSAICREPGCTADAADFLDRIKTTIPPDADSFAILLEGWEKEGNPTRAKTTFGEMVIRVGWNKDNVSAYDAFLTTLVRGSESAEAVKFLKVMKSKECLPGLKFFSSAINILARQNDHVNALAFWDVMVTDSGLVPSRVMFNAMIGLLCNNGNIDSAYRILDSMPFHAVFPDSQAYNMIFEALVSTMRAGEAAKFLKEMRKNEHTPSASSCASAIRLFFDQFDPSTALEVWSCVLEEKISPKDECGNELLLGLTQLGRMNEVRRYAEDMLDSGIELRLSTIEKMKNAYSKQGRQDTFDRLFKKIRPH